MLLAGSERKWDAVDSLAASRLQEQKVKKDCFISGNAKGYLKEGLTDPRVVIVVGVMTWRGFSADSNDDKPAGLGVVYWYGSNGVGSSSNVPCDRSLSDNNSQQQQASRGGATAEQLIFQGRE